MTSWRRFLQGWGFLSANNARGNFAVGENVTQIYLQGNENLLGVTATEPSLPFAPLHDAFEGAEPDIASLLRWRYRLVETLYGREQEIDDIKAWANSDREDILVRLVEGEGGSGKTRLGAEVAESLRNEGWSAGFLARSGSLIHPAGRKGLFLIVDYPEEQPERIKALIDSIRSCPQPGYRLRFLLLSRRSYEEWGDTFGPVRDLVGRQAIAHLGPLPAEQAKRLIVEASGRLAKQLDCSAGELRGLDEWLAASRDNRLSLYATAAAVHHVLAPTDTFGLAAPEIVADLVTRELSRVTGASRAAMLGEHALPRLLALATITGKLIPAVIERLAKPEQQIFECPENLAIDRLRNLPWWDREDKSLPALTPDVLAAVLTSRILSERPEMAPQWLWAVMEDGIGSDFAARVGRVIYDIDRMEREPSEIPMWLEQIVKDHPARAARFFEITYDQWLPHRLAGLSGTAGVAIADAIEDDEIKTFILNNTSVHLSSAGRYTEALQAIRRTVEIRERLAAANPAPLRAPSGDEPH
jgi:hypothetical protein